MSARGEACVRAYARSFGAPLTDHVEAALTPSAGEGADAFTGRWTFFIDGGSELNNVPLERYSGGGAYMHSIFTAQATHASHEASFH